MNFVTLQKALNKLGAKPQLKLTGLNDDQTKAAVEAFQKANSLTPIDGQVGPITGTAIAQKLNPTGIPMALACIMDCTDWDMPSGGWVMPKNCGNYRFFYQQEGAMGYPGGGYGAKTDHNQLLQCGHIQVPYDPAVLAWLDAQMKLIRSTDPNSDYFALMIMGLAFGDKTLSDMEPAQNILKNYNVRTQIVEEGTFFHENQNANQAILFNEALKGAKLIVAGHSMGGDEVPPIISGLNREFVLNI